VAPLGPASLSSLTCAPAIIVSWKVVNTAFSDAMAGDGQGFVLPFCGEEDRVDRDLVATQHSLRSSAVTVFLGPGAGFPGPASRIRGFHAQPVQRHDPIV
jgi:hypothetical protein